MLSVVLLSVDCSVVRPQCLVRSFECLVFRVEGLGPTMKRENCCISGIVDGHHLAKSWI